MPEYLQKRFQSHWIRTYLTAVALISYVFTKTSVGNFSQILAWKPKVFSHMNYLPSKFSKFKLTYAIYIIFSSCSFFRYFQNSSCYVLNAYLLKLLLWPLALKQSLWVTESKWGTHQLRLHAPLNNRSFARRIKWNNYNRWILSFLFFFFITRWTSTRVAFSFTKLLAGTFTSLLHLFWESLLFTLF